MNTENLKQIAQYLLTSGKGILAADESMNTVGKRFAPINLENTEENRRAFRHMLLTAPGESEYISGVILYDETIRQNDADGKSFADILAASGILPGIKVDLGLADFGSGEKVTQGLDTLPARLAEYSKLGAKFAKWRSVITIGQGLPSPENIQKNAADLAEYARMCQEADIVPIVEPEVLMDGNHDMESCKKASLAILHALFSELDRKQVLLEGLILKTNMILPGKEWETKATAEEIAKNTVEVFAQVLPDRLAGVVFLSGGQSEKEATVNLNAINQLPKKHTATFSYARALQDSATKVWAGKPENVESAQKVFLHRAKMNSLASLGKYSEDAEQGFEDMDGASESQD